MIIIYGTEVSLDYITMNNSATEHDCFGIFTTLKYTNGGKSVHFFVLLDQFYEKWFHEMQF